MEVVDKIRGLFRKDKNKKLVFFFDEDGSLQEELDEIQAAGINVLKVEDNYFSVKAQLELEFDPQEYFIYHPFPKPGVQELKSYPLLNLLIANQELRLDDASELLEDYGLAEHYLPLVKRYLRQLKTRTNQKKLTRILNHEQFNEANLKRGLISIKLGFHSVVERNICIARLFNLAIDQDAFNKRVAALVELDLDRELFKWVNGLLGSTQTQLSIEGMKEWARILKYNILAAHMRKTVPEDTYRKLKIQNSASINRILAFFQDWQDHPSEGDKIEAVWDTLASEIDSTQMIQWYGEDQEFGYYTKEMLTQIVSSYYSFAVERPSKTKSETHQWLEDERLTDGLQQQTAFIYHAASALSQIDSYPALSLNKPGDFIEAYTEQLHFIDRHFRKAISIFDQVRDRLGQFEEQAMKVFDTLNDQYDRFLIDLNVSWQQALQEIEFDYQELPIDKQFDFYQRNLKDIDRKTVVIISDALRYELGEELFEELIGDARNEVTLEPALASIPSYTNLGMTNLLPHDSITVQQGEKELSFSIDARSTVSSNRASILQSKEPKSSTIDYTEVIKLSQSDGRAYFKEHPLVYVYHDWIDAIGDKKRTEYEAFEASSKAVEDIKRLVQKLYGWNVYHVKITSDHGFLFNYNTLQENSREYLPESAGNCRDHVRFVVAEKFKGEADGYEFDLRKTTNIDTDLKVRIPRAINRFRKQGNVGVQFVHGGASLQELLIPVLTFQKHREETQNEVQFKRIDQTDKINSGSLKVSLLQDQAVSNEYKSADIVLGIYSDTGELLSNEVELSLDSTSGDPKERLVEVVLSLNTKGSNSSFGYLNAYRQKDSARLNPVSINDLIKINSLMEKDEF